MGVNVGGGIALEQDYVEIYTDEGWETSSGPGSDDFVYPRFSLGVDLAFPLGKMANLGFYFYGGYPDVGIGPLALFNFNKMSLYFGTGAFLHYVNGALGWSLRLGFATKKYFYMFVDMSPIPTNGSGRWCTYVFTVYARNSFLA